ncbi:MAG: response regulator [Candidatus Thiodiazotropha sp.]
MFTREQTPSQDPLTELPGLIRKIEANWPVLPSGIWNSSSVRTLSRHLHELARRSMQFGLTDLQGLAGVIDERINDIVDLNSPPDSDQIDLLNGLLQQLKQTLPDQESDTASDAAQVPAFDLLHLPRDDEEAAAIHQAADQRHWRYHAVTDLQALSDELEEHGAKALLINAAYLPEIADTPDLLRSAGKAPKPGRFFISDQTDIETRLLAMRAGAKQLFSAPVDVDAVIAALSEQIDPKSRPHHRVLVFEDDESQARFAADLLHKGDLETLAVTDPLGVIDAVRRFQPDLILMDLYMPGADGIELTKLIRGRAETVAIPIVFLSGEDDLEKKLLALQSGADDFLTKPVRPQQLLATVKTRIERSKAISTAGIPARLDTATGLPTRRELLSRLDLTRADIKSAQQYHALFVICVGDPQCDPEAWEKDTDGTLIEPVAATLIPLLSAEDYLARIEPQRLALLVRRTTEQDLEQFGERVCDTINSKLEELAKPEEPVGIGLALLDGSAKGAYEQLLQAESTAESAYRQGLRGYALFGESPLSDETAQADTDKEEQRDSDRFLESLHNGDITVQALPFTAQPGSGKHQETFELIPQLPAVDGGTGNPSQMAATYGVAVEFDHYLRAQAIRQLGENAMRGKLVRLIFRQSAASLQASDFIEQIKAELRRMQVVGTGLMMEFDLPTLAADLKQARLVFGELAALGISISLANFACNETAYKVLAYLKADAVRPHPSLLRIEAQRIHHITTQIHSLRAEVILPVVERHGQIALPWSESADYIQTDFAP